MYTLPQVRIAAVEAIAALVPCGAQSMVQELAAWQDPSYVPVAAFYGPSVRVNYLARLAVDGAVAVMLRKCCPHAWTRLACAVRVFSIHSCWLCDVANLGVQVRLAFLAMLAQWLERLPDCQDQQGRLLPYILAALCDPCPAVSSAARAALDRLGVLHEGERSGKRRVIFIFTAQSLAALLRRSGELLRRVLQNCPAVCTLCMLPALFQDETDVDAELMHAAHQRLHGSTELGRAEMAADGDEVEAASRALTQPLKGLMSPVVQRPRLGVRLLVQVQSFWFTCITCTRGCHMGVCKIPKSCWICAGELARDAARCLQ